MQLLLFLEEIWLRQQDTDFEATFNIQTEMKVFNMN